MKRILSPLFFMKVEGKHMCAVCMTATILVLIGAINWGLVGIGMFMSSNWNVVNLLLGHWMWLEALIYILVGLSGVWKIFMFPKCCGKNCAQCENPSHKT